MDDTLVENCRKLLRAYRSGELGQTQMPEDSNPGFSSEERELRLAYFTLPMALNYQRDSYALWKAALKTVNDPETRFVFNVAAVATASEEEVRVALLKYKLALQPNKHIETWRRISATISEQWGSVLGLVAVTQNDFLSLKQVIQLDHKKGFPYLSGPKIFNYWSFILGEYGEVFLKNKEYIEIAPDTHILQCSIKLGVITVEEGVRFSRDEISDRWRKFLSGSGITPIEMHAPLWFWSRNGFLYSL